MLRYTKKITLGLLSLTGLVTLSQAAVPAEPGSYVGVYNVTDTTANISFTDMSNNEDGFHVYDQNNNLLATLPAGAGGFQYTMLTGLTPATLYLLHITAFNADGESTPTVPSSQNNGRFHTDGNGCTVPATPGNYVGRWDITSDSARISFKDNSNDETKFKVSVLEYTSGTVVQTIDVPELPGMGDFQYQTLTSLLPNTIYKVMVRAVNACGESAPTSPSSADGGIFKTLGACDPVATPGNYIGRWAITSSSVRIAFTDNSNNEDGFKVYVRDYHSGVIVKTLTMPAGAGVGSKQYLTITGLAANTIYKLTATAYTACNESLPTTASSADGGIFRTKP